MQKHWGHLVLMGILSRFCKTVAEKVVIGSSEKNCELWIPKDFKNLQQNDKVIITGSAFSHAFNTPVQIGVYVTHTRWMNFEGCTLRSHNGSCVHQLSGEADPIVECYEHCNQATFSTYNGCCFCNGYGNTTSFCPAKHCFSNFSGLCGEYFGDKTSGCFCQYQPIPMEYSGFYNCLQLYHSRKQSIHQLSQQCDTDLNYFGVPTDFSKNYPKTKWWTAALSVQKELKQFANATYLKSKITLLPGTYYWVGTFRKQILVRERPNKTENFCGTVLKTSEGAIRFRIKLCNSSSLQKLCVTKDDSSLVPRTTTTTESHINTTRPTDGCVFTANNKCTTIDTIPTDQEDGLGESGVIVITVVVIVIILVMISLGIFFKNRRTARSPSMMSEVSGSTDYIPAPRNVYISQSAMHEHRGEATPNENGYSEVCIEDQIAESAYSEIEIANAEVPINIAQNRLRNSKNDDHYDSFGNVKKGAAEQSDISNSNYDHVQRTVNVDAYDVFERNDDVTMSDYDQMDKLVNNEYDTFNTKGDAATDVNTDYDHVDLMTENDQHSRTSV